MMKKLLFVPLLLCGAQAMAAPHLSVGENLVVLAAKSADVSIFSDNIALKEGEQKVVVKYDSPENPSSTNQSNGRVTSKAYLLTFKAAGDEVIELTTPAAADTAEVRALAKDPVFKLTANGSAVKFERSALIQSGGLGALTTSWDSVVNGDKAAAPAAPTASAVQGESDSLKAMQKLYLQSDATQRKAFLKWALDQQ
jgi:Uncharacterized protein conserved in bacteria